MKCRAAVGVQDNVTFIEKGCRNNFFNMLYLDHESFQILMDAPSPTKWKSIAMIKTGSRMPIQVSCLCVKKMLLDAR